MYESKNEPLLPTHHFTKRMLVHILYAIFALVITMIIGVIAHLLLEPLEIHDAILNTAFMVAGLGAVFVPETGAGKLFFALYGMFIGLVFVGILGLILAPLSHRIIHKFHLDDDENA